MEVCAYNTIPTAWLQLATPAPSSTLITQPSSPDPTIRLNTEIAPRMMPPLHPWMTICMPMPPSMRYRVAESFWSTITTYMGQRHGLVNHGNKKKIAQRTDLQVPHLQTLVLSSAHPLIRSTSPRPLRLSTCLLTLNFRRNSKTGATIWLRTRSSMTSAGRYQARRRTLVWLWRRTPELPHPISPGESGLGLRRQTSRTKPRCISVSLGQG